uniref:Uncharacterized protein LOC104228221 n=1 Tax=Nicotiana sylvestris TaxID=4096 RepID=A0A1U7WK70_NICSY|nr:PREDICTED: uncharacterized protein LOC104228221 [Nicotiana sylvestris]
MLVSILEAFEEMKLNVVQARVTSRYFFGMEAIVETEDEALDVRVVTKAVQLAIQNLKDRLYLTALPKATIPTSTPSKKGHSETINQILRSVPSPGLGH